MLLGAPGIVTRSMDATRGSWPYLLGTRMLLGACSPVLLVLRRWIERASRSLASKLETCREPSMYSTNHSKTS